MCTIVRTGSSHIGTSRARTPRRVRKSSLIALKLSPPARRRVRSTWVARSASPSRNQVSPPSRSSACMKVQVSSARPQPVSGLAMPASVYRTVSRSGEMLSLRCSKSSPVLHTTVRQSGGSVRYRPSASLAPPMPPESATTLAPALIGRDPPRARESAPQPAAAAHRMRARARARPAAPHRPRPSAVAPPRRSRRPIRPA